MYGRLWNCYRSSLICELAGEPDFCNTKFEAGIGYAMGRRATASDAQGEREGTPDPSHSLAIGGVPILGQPDVGRTLWLAS